MVEMMMTGCIHHSTTDESALNPGGDKTEALIGYVTIGSSNLGMPYLFCNAPSFDSDLTLMSANLSSGMIPVLMQ